MTHIHLSLSFYFSNFWEINFPKKKHYWFQVANCLFLFFKFCEVGRWVGNDDPQEDLKFGTGQRGKKKKFRNCVLYFGNMLEPIV